tara:strand:+ start:1496 stop:1702 length:207 start_codon:yes stop_codon:yes gene_type:complete
MDEISAEVAERLVVLQKQLKVNEAYLLEMVRETDWPSVCKVSSQLQAIAQEMESLVCIQERMQESYYE